MRGKESAGNRQEIPGNDVDALLACGEKRGAAHRIDALKWKYDGEGGSTMEKGELMAGQSE